MREAPSSGQSDAVQSVPTLYVRWDRVLIALVIAVLVGAGFALWRLNGASVFAEAITGLWALCF